MKKILIVDDEIDVLKALKSSLERQENFKVSTARNGEEALKDVEKEAPDIIVLDLMMPKMSGEELLALLRKNMKTMDTPVIISTVRRETASLINLMNLGATDYLMKPYDVRELIKLINTYI
jgi:two-component system OmpR family response regulator